LSETLRPVAIGPSLQNDRSGRLNQRMIPIIPRNVFSL
jgi:hypothetical protein